MAGGKFCFAFVALFVVACASSLPTENETNEVHNEKGLSIKSLLKCADVGGVAGIINCAAMRALKSLQQVSREQVLEVVPGVSLESDDTGLQRVGKEISEEQLPIDPEEKANKLYELLLENTANVFSGRTLKVKLPEDVVEKVSRALEEEGRKRKKGGKFPSFMMGMGAKMFALIPAVLGGLALLSTKALIIAKLALVLSVVVFVQSFLSKGSGTSLLGGLGGGFGGGQGHSIGSSYGTGVGGTYNPSTWTTNTLGGGNQYPYARSIDVAERSTSAQDLAYSQSRNL